MHGGAAQCSGGARSPIARGPSSRYHGFMRVPSLFALLGVLALFASCAPRLGQVVAITALDEAFAAARPALAGRLEKPPLLTGGLGLFLSPPLLIRVGLGEGAGKALDAALAEKKKKGRPVPIIASPLIAKAIVEGGSWSGDPPLFVPEWRGAEQRGLYSVSTNLVPALIESGPGAAAAQAGGRNFKVFLAQAEKEEASKRPNRRETRP